MSQKLEGPSHALPVATEERNPQSPRSAIARDSGASYEYRPQSLDGVRSSASLKIVTPVHELRERLQRMKFSKESVLNAPSIKKESAKEQIEPPVANSDSIEAATPSSQSFKLSGKSSPKSNQSLLRLRNS